MSNSAPKTLTVAQCKQLLDQLHYPGHSAVAKRRGIRDYTIALLMLDAGLRIGEVAKLNQNDLWFCSAPVKTVVIQADHSKNNVARSIPVSDRLYAAIVLLKTHVWPYTTSLDHDFAFVASLRSKPITVRQIRNCITQAAKKALGFPVNPHMLRHTFATRLMQQTSIRIVQQLLGHLSLSSTQIYTHPNADDLEQAIKNLNSHGQNKEA